MAESALPLVYAKISMAIEQACALVEPRYTKDLDGWVALGGEGYGKNQDGGEKTHGSEGGRLLDHLFR